MSWLKKRPKPGDVRLIGDDTNDDVTRRLIYIGWHQEVHAWRLPVSPRELEQIEAGTLGMRIGDMPGSCGLVVTVEGSTELPPD